MRSVRSRLVSVLVSLLLGGVMRMGIQELSPELAGRVDPWVVRTLELALFAGYGALRARLRREITSARRAPTPPPPSP